MTITMALTEGQSLTTETMALAVTVKLTVTLLIHTNRFSWDEALLEHRHLG